METNPYTTGFVDFNSHLGGFIPTCFFESPFSQGQSQKLFPEESLGSFLGIFGSAYSASLGDILNELKTGSTSEWFKSFVSWVEKKLPLYKDRVLRANVDNFMYNMQGYPLGNLEKITVADGGMSMINLPFIPLYTQNRDVDIFIVCDAAGDSKASDYPELKEMQNYAKMYNLPFPSLKNPKKYHFSNPDTGQLYKISVFEDDNPSIPTIVYFPCYTPEETLKFKYSNEEFENVCGTMEMMVLHNRQAIIDAINPGTTVGGSGMIAIVDGTYKGEITSSDALVKDNVVELLLNGTNYVTTIAEPITDYAKFKIKCERQLLNSDVGYTEYVFVRPATIAGYAPRLRLDLSVNILSIHALINKKIKVFPIVYTLYTRFSNSECE